MMAELQNEIEWGDERADGTDSLTEATVGELLSIESPYKRVVATERLLAALRVVHIDAARESGEQARAEHRARAEQ